VVCYGLTERKVRLEAGRSVRNLTVVYGPELNVSSQRVLVHGHIVRVAVGPVLAVNVPTHVVFPCYASRDGSRTAS